MTPYIFVYSISCATCIGVADMVREQRRTVVYKCDSCGTTITVRKSTPSIRNTGL